MTIQWYPGHMYKAQKEMRQVLPQIDVLVEVLDARIPFSSENPMIAKLRGDKPCIKVLSKHDLADAVVVNKWQRHFEEQRTVKTLTTSISQPTKIHMLQDLCLKLLPAKAQGASKIRAMIVGIPNVGKSTLINMLVGKAIAKTGNEPAVTKGQQTVKLSEHILLLDTPGILWPKQEYENSSYRLAVTGAIKDTAMEYADIAFFIFDYLRDHYEHRLQERYDLQSVPADSMEFFESIGRARGCLGRGGRVDLTKISELFIKDLRSGALGGLCLETPEEVVVELAHHVREQELAAQKKQNKKGPKSKRSRPSP